MFRSPAASCLRKRSRPAEAAVPRPEEVKFEDVRVYLVERKMGRSRRSFLTQLATSKGFIVEDNLSDKVTHVVSEDSQAASLWKWLKECSPTNPPDVHVLDISWFTDSMREGRPVAVETRHLIQDTAPTSPEGSTPTPVAAVSQYACQRRTTTENNNKIFTDAFEVLAENYEFNEIEGPCLAFRRAASVLKSLPWAVRRLGETQDLPCLGEHTKAVMEEVLQCGRSFEVEKLLSDERYQTLKLFTSVFGVGPKTADKWHRRGLRSFSDVLADRSVHLNRMQQSGFLHYGDISRAVSKAEARSLRNIIEGAACAITPSAVLALTGGFRRGKEFGHDVDFIVTTPALGMEESLLPKIIDGLKNQKSRNVVDVLDQSRQTPGSQRSVSVPHTPAATSNKHEETRWRSRLFGRHMPKKEKQSVATSQVDKSTNAEKAKKPWWSRLCRKSRWVAPASKEQNLKEQSREEVEEFKGLTEEEEMHLRMHETALQREEKISNPNTESLKQQKIKCLGFPNPGQICYINSCLQSLLTLEDFVRAISCQEHLWNLIPEAALMRSFMAIQRSHLSDNALHKICLLGAFKSTIWSPEFQDLLQKDAHEFLTSVLEQMRCLSPMLQRTAASMGRSYSCPVEDHMVFKMVNTRTCKGCGLGSTREELFTNLSLDVVPGGRNVEQMLQDYLTEKELEYNCECGATASGQRSSFLTLPRVLVLHLKRFRFTPHFQLTKIHDPVVLLRELVVSSNQDAGCYSLVSTINHIGLTASCGHYICDGVDGDVGEEDPTDRWFTYNDAEVTETSGESVCDQRKENSYILSYRRM